MLVNDRYTQINTPVNTPIETAVGDTNYDTANNSVSITESENTEAPIEDVSTEEVDEPQAENQSVNVGDVYESDGNIFAILSRDNEKTTYTLTDKSGKTSTQIAPNAVADANFSNVNSYRKVQSGSNATFRTSENAPVASNTTARNKNVSSNVVDESDSQVTAVVDAINETIIPGGKETLLKAFAKQGRRADTITLAKTLRKSYKHTGTLGKMANFFTDKGAKVISAIEGTMDTKPTKKVSASGSPKKTSKSIAKLSTYPASGPKVWATTTSPC